ncbi:hypothetical protein HWV62_12076 [Athelia sp. TMB]|nr:hypothetical protein HWV62_12076 [Athelia sp. TMB]
MLHGSAYELYMKAQAASDKVKQLERDDPKSTASGEADDPKSAASAEANGSKITPLARAKKEKQEIDALVKNFKKKLSTEDVQVHFIGVWDTVSSIGLKAGNSSSGIYDSPKHTCIFRHALALDECRVKFSPECVMQNTPDSQDTPANAKEVWFAGAHSDVGGIHSVTDKDTSEWNNVPLSWMLNEAIMAGLLLKESGGSWLIKDLGKKPATISLEGMWWILEYLPLRRASRSDPNKTTRPEGYEPRATFPPQSSPSLDWRELVAQGKSGALGSVAAWQPRLELDVFDIDAVSTLVEMLRDKNISESVADHTLRRIGFIVSLRGGQRAIVKVSNVMKTLESFLPREEPPSNVQSTAPTITPNLFMATLKLLAQLATSVTSMSPTKAATKNRVLKEQASEAILQSTIYRTLVDSMIKSGEGRPSPLAGQYARTLTALTTLDKARSAIMQSNPSPLPILVKLLGTSENSGPALSALAALQVTGKDLDDKNQLGPAVEALIKLLRGSYVSSIPLTAALMLSSIAALGDKYTETVQLAIQRTKIMDKFKSNEVSAGLEKKGSIKAATFMLMTDAMRGTEAQSSIKIDQIVDALGADDHGVAVEILLVLASKRPAREEMIQRNAVGELVSCLEKNSNTTTAQALINLIEYGTQFLQYLAHRLMKVA